jgi:hypothetical protein
LLHREILRRSKLLQANHDDLASGRG